jgi:DNA-binding CsgD family transcriptional regulator/GAF domain-containing protein
LVLALTEPTDEQVRAAELSLALQSALTVRDVQANYLDTVGSLVSADAYGFSHFDPLDDRLTPLTVLTRRAPEGLVPAYNDLGAGHDPLLAAAVSTRSPVDDTSLKSGQAWTEQSVYEVLSGNGLYHSMVVALSVESRVMGALYLARAADGRPFSARDRAAMLVVKRHTEVALQRAVRHEELSQHASLLTWALDELDLPVIVNSPMGEVLFENKALQRLRRAHYRAGAHLAELLSDNLRQLGRGSRRVVARSDSLVGGRVARPAEAGQSDLRLVLKSTAVRRGPGAMVSFVFVQRKDVTTPVERAPLSAREREIVAWVAQGLTNRRIAELGFVTENTVRQHLKRIFSKLGVHNRAQLIQAVWQGGDDEP